MTLKMEFDTALEQEFRKEAMRKFGYSKGSIKKAGEAAIRTWVGESKHDLPKSTDHLKSLIGCLKHLRGKVTSVELQHEAMKIWTKEK